MDGGSRAGRRGGRERSQHGGEAEDGARLIRALLAPSSEGRPSAGTRQDVARVVRVDRSRARRRASGTAQELLLPLLVRVALRVGLGARQVDGHDAPGSGSAYGTVMPPTSGNDRSQTGSWITTGTSSQRCSSARRHARSSGGTRKSERTKTNVCVGSSRLCWRRCSRLRETVSAGASKGRRRTSPAARSARFAAAARTSRRRRGRRSR